MPINQGLMLGFFKRNEGFNADEFPPIRGK